MVSVSNDGNDELELLNRLSGDGGQGPFSASTGRDLGIIKQLLKSPDDGDDFIGIVLICDFLDEEEANRELAAFYEAERLGMNTKYNIAHALSRAAINRKGAHSNSRGATAMQTISRYHLITSRSPNDKIKEGDQRSNNVVV